MKRLVLLVLLFSFSITASAARMYQWIDPDSGTTQLSGKPPQWYRSSNAGPRVVVFESGKVIDDTGIELSVAENERLRQQALIIVENDRLAAMQKLAESEQQRAVFDSETGQEEVLTVAEPAGPQQSDEPTTDEDTEATMTEQMRELLEQFEALKTQNARQLVESANTENGPPTR